MDGSMTVIYPSFLGVSRWIVLGDRDTENVRAMMCRTRTASRIVLVCCCLSLGGIKILQGSFSPID